MADVTTVAVNQWLGCTWDADTTEQMVVGSSAVNFASTLPTTIAPNVPVNGLPGAYRDQSIFQDSSGKVWKARSNYDVSLHGSEPVARYTSPHLVFERLRWNSTDGYYWEHVSTIEVASKIAAAGDTYVDVLTCVTSSPEWANDVVLSSGRKRVFFMFQAAGMPASAAPASNSLIYYMDSTDATFTAFSDPLPITGTCVPTRGGSPIEVPGWEGTITSFTANQIFDTAAHFGTAGNLKIDDAVYIKWWLQFLDGPGAGYKQIIDGGNNDTGIGQVSDFPVQPVAGNHYRVFAKVTSIIDPFHFVQADGKHVILGRAFVQGNDVDSTLPVIALVSSTGSTSGYNTCFFLWGGVHPGVFIEGSFVVKNGDGSLTIAGDDGTSLAYASTSAGVGNVSLGMFQGLSGTAAPKPSGVDAMRHFTPAKMTTALPAGLENAALSAGTLSGPASTTSNRLNGFTFTAGTGGTGAITYQAQYKLSTDAGWVNITGATTSPFDARFLAPSSTYNVRVRVQDDTDTAYTNTITAATSAASGGNTLTAGTLYGPKTIRAGKALGFQFDRAQGTAGTVQYQAQYKLSGDSTYTDAAGDTSSPFDLTGFAAGTYNVRVMVDDQSANAAVYSNVLTVVIP